MSGSGWRLRAGFVLLAGFLFFAFRRYSGYSKSTPVSPHTEDSESNPPLEQDQIVTLVGLAMGEATGFMGVVLFLLTGEFLDLFLALGAAAVFFLSYFPRRAKLERLARERGILPQNQEQP